MIRATISAVAGTWASRRTGRVVAATLLACLAGLAGVLLGGCSKLFPHRAPGEQLYVDHCADCHGLDGRGNTAREMGQSYADLTDDVWKFGGDDTSIANVIREGSFGLMPGFQQQLNDQQIQELVAYLRVLRKRAADGAP
ncbi:MAG TPA: c-type cytochrome [Thermoanaerobaculia bacterium]|jgi:cytochrome c553|nr:c-type cytochrome [Thermoanaerobaculia bacterium]